MCGPLSRHLRVDGIRQHACTLVQLERSIQSQQLYKLSSDYVIIDVQHTLSYWMGEEQAPIKLSRQCLGWMTSRMRSIVASKRESLQLLQLRVLQQHYA